MPVTDVIADDAVRPPAVANDDSFRQRGFDFFFVGGHLVPLFQGDQFDLLRAEPQRGPGHVHRDVAAADDNDVFLDTGLVVRRRPVCRNSTP